MSVALYMDVHMPRSVTDALRRRGASVLTSQEDGTHEWDDDRLLARATELDRVFVTQDEDLLAIAHRWQAAGTDSYRSAYRCCCRYLSICGGG